MKASSVERLRVHLVMHNAHVGYMFMWRCEWLWFLKCCEGFET
jgi:hypothetical protein